jgi:hypothetical protein
VGVADAQSVVGGMGVEGSAEWAQYMEEAGMQDPEFRAWMEHQRQQQHEAQRRQAEEEEEEGAEGPLFFDDSHPVEGGGEEPKGRGGPGSPSWEANDDNVPPGYAYPPVD